MKRRLARLRRSLEELFPERHLYVRSGGRMRGYVLTPKVQMTAAAGLAAAALWMGISTASMLTGVLSAGVAEAAGRSQHGIADRARPTSGVAQLDARGGGADQLAAAAERRHAALALLLTDLKDAPGAAQALTPVVGQGLAARGADPLQRLKQVEAGQEQLLEAADAFARSRAGRLRLAFRLAGLTPATYLAKREALGGPLIEPRDPRALAAVLDVDPDFAGRIEHAAADLSEAHQLADAAGRLPLARPISEPERSSGFGVRIDPFTHRPAFHTGLDFPGGRLTPVYATGPGVVAFTGVRSGYGQVVEVDHGGGLKTRYAHLQSVNVQPGERVALGARLGGMGSSGRSTGTHLHYEVWLNGRPLNPERFLKAGTYVNGAG